MSSTDVKSDRKRSSFWTFLIAFLLAAGATLLLVLALIFGTTRLYDGKILPGVHVGGVDVSGLTRDEARDRLAGAYRQLGDGTIKVDTPTGEAIIKFADIGRAADIAAMVDSAYAVGRSGDALTQVAETAGTLVRQADLPVAVKLDTQALATKLRALSQTEGVAPKNAQVDLTVVPFKVVPSATGRGLDEAIIGRQIVQQLSAATAPATISVTGEFIKLDPQIADPQAQAAAAAGEKMVGDVTLTLGDKKFTAPAATIRKSLRFGLRPDGSFAPSVDRGTIQTFLADVAPKVAQAPVNPTFLLGKDGKPIGVTSGKSGKALDVDATAEAIATYVESLGTGASTANVTLLMADVAPKMDDSEISGMLPEMQKLGGWTVKFIPGISNCNGKNIRTPAAHINGTVVAPGQTFSFWDGVGPVDEAHGFCKGGMIKNGKSDYTGAMGGGICSTSTTMFNAALHSGVEIVERHNHYYWIDRYPAGLDATVFWDGPQKLDMRWRNDTDHAILILGRSTTTSVTFELWSVPTGRTVDVPKTVVKRDIVKATWKTVYVTTLPPGVKHVVEGAYDGFKITRTRTVKDAAGNVIHNDVFYTHYGKVDGIIEVGVSAAPKPTPTPVPSAAAGYLFPFVFAFGKSRRWLARPPRG